MIKKEEKQLRKFVQTLPLVMNEAGRLGLWRTMHKLHDVVRESGYELADILTGKQKVMVGNDKTRKRNH